MRLQILVASLSSELTQRAYLVAELVAVQPEIWREPARAHELLDHIQTLPDASILLLKPDGTLFATSGQAATPQPVFRLTQEDLARAAAGEIKVTTNYGLAGVRMGVWVPVRNVNGQMAGIVELSEALQGISSLFGHLRQLVVAALVGELIGGAVLGLLLAARLARPINRTAGALIDLAEDKQFRPLLPEGPEEIRQAAAAVNALANRLRLLEETRRRSLANIVHELGRPLGGIRAAAHTLRQAPGADPAVREELLGGIEGQIERMEPLLDDLAQLHDQLDRRVVLNLQSVSVGDWLSSVLVTWRAAATEKGLRWEASIDQDLPEVRLDPTRMAQAVGNLLGNAVKYTPPGGTVTLQVGSEKHELSIRVSDTGPGIAPEDQAHVFEPFYRSDRGRRFPEGLGLGLTIARDVVEAHHGRLELESALGKGSCFTIQVPMDAGS